MKLAVSDVQIQLQKASLHIETELSFLQISLSYSFS